MLQDTAIAAIAAASIRRRQFLRFPAAAAAFFLFLRFSHAFALIAIR